MFGCCDKAMRWKYINEDGTIDEARVTRIFNTDKIECKLENNWLGKEVKVPYAGDGRICKCECHQDGFMVMC